MGSENANYLAFFLLSFFFFLIPQLQAFPPLTHAPGPNQGCWKWGTAAWHLGVL